MLLYLKLSTQLRIDTLILFVGWIVMKAGDGWVSGADGILGLGPAGIRRSLYQGPDASRACPLARWPADDTRQISLLCPPANS